MESKNSLVAFAIMGGFKAATILALLAISCNAKSYWKNVIPQDKEVVYDYSALVKAGTHVPHLFTSQFLLKGKLHLQLISDYELLVRLDNLEHDYSNGKESELPDFSPKPSHLTNITQPFKILYEDNGTVKEIVLSEDEPEYSLNMKKAIAAMLQVNWEKIPLDSVKPFAFSSKEKSLFGFDDTLYDVMPDVNILKFYRMHYMAKTAHIYDNVMSDFTGSECDSAYEEPITHDTQKLYVIDRTDSNQHKLKYMESNGGVYFQPMQAKSSAFYVYINQTFHLLEIKDKVEVPVLQNELKYDTLKYIMTEKSLFFENITDPKILLPIVEKLLEELAAFIEEDKLVEALPDIGKGQLVNRILIMLFHLDTVLLEELHTNLHSKPILNIYQQLIPMIGTSNSLKFILKLVKNNQVSEDVAVNMLQNMAVYIKIPTEQLLTELDEMTRLNNVPYKVQKTSILSYGSLLYKLYYFNYRQGIKNNNIFIKYIELFVNKLKTSVKMEDKNLYIDALYNMKNDLTVRYLEPLVKGEWFNDNNLRYKAMIALSPLLTKAINVDKMYELYWPIFTNTILPSYMRIMAFTLMMKSKPSISMQVNMYSFMQFETDVDLLSFYYTYLKSLTESENPCLYKSKLQAKQLLLYWPLSYTHSLTGYYQIDGTNWKYNYGYGSNMFLVNTEEALVFWGQINSQFKHLQFNPESFYVKVTGVDRKFLDNIHLNTQKGMPYFNYEKLFEIFTQKKDTIQIEMIHQYKKQIISSVFFDKNNMKDFNAYFKIFYERQFSENKKTLDIHFDMMIQLPIITDIGFPVVFELIMPSIHETTTKLRKETINNDINVSVDNMYRVMNYYSYGLYFHNPFASIWHGVTKYMYMETQLPIHLNARLNSQENALKLTWKIPEDHSEAAIGYRSYAQTYTILLKEDYKNYPKQNHFDGVSATYADKYKHNITLIDTEEYNLGYRYRLNLFNDVNPEHHERFSTYKDFLLSSEPWSETIMRYILESTYQHLQYDVAERGVLLRMEPSVKNPVTSLDLTISLNHKLKETGYSIPQPALTLDLGVVYDIKKEEKLLKSWNVRGSLDLNNGHSINALEVNVTKSVPGEVDYKVCIHGKETYSIKDLSGDMTITMGPSADGKCNKDEGLIQIIMLAQRLPEQHQGLHNYEICSRPTSQLIHDLKPYSCYMKQSSLRNYAIDVETTNLPADFENIISYYWTMFLAKYYDNYEHSYVTSGSLPKNNIKVQLWYPISKNIIDMKVTTPVEIHEFNGLLANDFERLGIYPDNLYYGNINYITHFLNLTDICIIDESDFKNIVSDDWVLFHADPQLPKYGLWVKLHGKKLAVKIVSPVYIFMITPTAKDYTITIDGMALNVAESMYYENMGLMKMDDSNTLVYFGKHYGGMMVYNEDQLLIELPKTDIKLSGKCFEKKH